jgi:hypothetical protein
MSWRDSVGVHAAAELFPMMDDDQLNNHQERPRDRFAAFVLLDGRNRLEAIERSIPDPEERARSAVNLLRPNVARP